MADLLFFLGQAVPTLLAALIVWKKRYSLAAFASGVLAALAFPPCEFSFFAWFCLIPWLYSLPKLNLRQVLVSSLVFGLTYFGIGIVWMATVHPLSPFAILIPLCLVLLPFSFSYRALSRVLMPMWLAAPILWVANDYLRCYILTGLPWLYMSHTLAYETTIIQFADITGAYGVTFLVVWVNAVVAHFIFQIKEQDRKIPNHLYAGAILSVIAIISALLYGNKQLETTYKEGPRISCIQGNIPQDIKDDVSQLRTRVFNTYTKLSLEALKEKPDMLVWPETMTPGDCNLNPESWEIFHDLAKENNVNLFLGSHHYELNHDNKTSFSNNSAYFFNRKGIIAGRYDKIRLVPVGETIPFSTYIPFVPAMVYFLVGYVPDLQPGKTRPVFHLDNKYKFGGVICFDIIYPDETRILAKQGCDFVINVTNEAWFTRSSELEQITAISIFRAIENRVGVVRVGNSGVTLAIPPTGKLDPKYIFVKPIDEYWNSLPSYMQERLKDRFVINWHYLPQALWGGKGSFISRVKDSWDIEIKNKKLKWKDFPGIFTTNVPIRNTEKNTIYTLYGDWFPQMLSILSILSILVLLYKGRTNEHTNDT